MITADAWPLKRSDPARSASVGRSVRPAKVLYVIDDLTTPAAGTERQLLELIGGLDQTRYEPHVAVFRQSEFLQSCSTFPCPMHLLNIDQFASPTGLIRLGGVTALVRRLGAGLAHTFFNDASIAAPFFCRVGGARTLSSRRDMGFWYTPTILRALRVSNRFVNLIVANSEAVKRNVHEREGFPLDKIAVVANGHDPRRFDAPPLPGFRERHGIAAGDKIIGMVANLYERKRQADLIRALPAIRQTHGPAHVVLAGSGPDGERLQSLAASLGLDGAVHIVQGVSDVIPIVKHFDVAVLCSESEGFSNAIIEYAFCGRPIVCTDVGGNPEFIKHQESGLHVQCGDVGGLSRAVAELLANPQLAERLSADARDDRAPLLHE